MKTLTPREQRTVTIAAIGIGIYLILFFGVGWWKRLEGWRDNYHRLAREAQKLEEDLRPYENRILLLEKLRTSFLLEPNEFSREVLMSKASAAIQGAAQSSGVKLGSIREVPGRASAYELASMQLEANGPIHSLLALLHQLEALGYPLVIESVQFSQESGKPGMAKLALTVVFLNFDAWQKKETQNA